MKYLCVLIVMMTAGVLMAAEPVGRITQPGPPDAQWQGGAGNRCIIFAGGGGRRDRHRRLVGHDLFR